MTHRSLWPCVLAVAACVTDAERPSSEFEGLSRVASHDLPAAHKPMLDLLFIIDDTTAMAAYQDQLAMLPAALEDVLANNIYDLHLAVTSDGQLRRIPSVGGSFMTLSTEYDLSRSSNFEGSFRDTYSLLANVGAANAGTNQPLAALLRVLDENPDDFRRDRAPLGVVIISASDDISPGVVSEYVLRTKGSMADPSNIYVTAIAAAPSPRLDELLASFPNRNRATPLSGGDYLYVLEPFRGWVRTVIPLTCWEASDVDADTPGAQYDCTFSVTIRGAERVLPPCKLAGDQFCWSLEDTSLGCGRPAVRPVTPPWGEFVFRPALKAQCVVN